MFESIDIILLLAGAGLIAGFLAGLLGIGGGLVTIPAQIIVYDSLGFPPEWKMHIAIATSLGIIIATNMSSVWAHHRRGSVNWTIIRDWGLVIAIGSVIGSYYATALKTDTLVYAFATLGAVLALKMLLPLDHISLGETLPKGKTRFLPPAMIGFFSAILGIGGGSFSVPYMSLYQVQIQRAVGTASMLGLIISIAGGASYLVSGLSISGLPDSNIGFINLPSLVIISLAAVVMAPIGARVAHSISKRILNVVFGVFIVIAVTRLLMSVSA